MIKNIKRKLASVGRAFVKTIRAIEKRPISPGNFFVVFSAIIVVRMAEQQWLDHFPQYSIQGQFYEFVQTYLFFLFSISLFVMFLYFIARIRPERSVSILLIGFLIILLPPVVDTMRFDMFWSYYEFASIKELVYAFWTVYGASPNIGVTDGDRIEIVISVMAMGMYVSMHTRSLMRGVGAVFGSYVILFILASLPSWLAIGIYGWQQGFFSIGAAHVAQMFLSPNPILTRIIDDINIVLHVHMGIVYALGMVAVGFFMAKVFFRDVWHVIKKNMVRWNVISAVAFFGCGVGAWFVFGMQTIYIFTLSAFAIPAMALLILSVILLTTGLNIIRFESKKYHDVGMLIVAHALFFGMIVHGATGFYMLVIIGLFILSTMRPFMLDNVPFVRYGIYALQGIFLYMMGVMILSHGEVVLLTTLRFVVFVGLSAIGILLFVNQRKMMRTGVAFYWFFLILSSIVFFNIFTYKWFIFAGAIAIFYLLHKDDREILKRKHVT